MKIKLVDKQLENIITDVEIVFILEYHFDHRFVADKALLNSLNFEAHTGEGIYVPLRKKLYVGLTRLTQEEVRIAAHKAVSMLKEYGYTNAKVGLYLDDDISKTKNVKAMVEGFFAGEYKFTKYKTKKKKVTFKEIIISTEEYENRTVNVERIENAINIAKKTAKSVNLVKDIVNTPAEDFTPQSMVQEAQKLANKYNLSINILDENDLSKENMNALLAVSRASRHEPKLIHLAYKPENPIATISLIGKGLTYDSGGLSLKPSKSMVSMKMDKAGSATVLGIMNAIAGLGMDVEVHAFLGMAENMIGGDAYKPDDILTARNGMTIEVQNTDAEGRLVLADVLSYSQDQVDADYIFDYATLTGACVLALGEYTTGVMGHSTQLKREIIRASQSIGEYSANLPFNRYLPKLLKSEIADICNIPSTPYGGAITAALFLDNFILKRNKDKWVHFDIAGTAYTDKPWGINGFGATGIQVRSTVKWIERLIKKNKKD